MPTLHSNVIVAMSCVGVFSTDYMYPKFNGLSSLTSKPYFISKLNFDAIPGMIVVGAAYVNAMGQ